MVMRRMAIEIVGREDELVGSLRTAKGTLR